MIYTDNQLVEIFGYLPKGLKLVGTSNGNKIYSSDDIQEKALRWMEESFTTRSFSEKIKEGLEKGSLMVGYTDKSFAKFLMKKSGSWVYNLMTGVTLTRTTGWYSRPDDNIVIILSHKNVSMLGKALNEMPSILTHELVHMCAYKETNSFYRLFQKDLKTFYGTLVSLHLNTNVKSISRPLDKLIYNMVFKFESSPNRDNEKIIFNIWGDFFNNIGYSNPSEIREEVLKITSPYIGESMSLDKRYEKYSRNVKRHLYDAYDSLGFNVRRTIYAYQEVLFPSEVIAITNQFKPKGDTVRLIESIRF